MATIITNSRGEPTKVMLGPEIQTQQLRRVAHIDANLAGFISWSRIVQALREHGQIKPAEDVEALVLGDDGIKLFYKEAR